MNETTRTGEGLAVLEQRLHRDLAVLCYPPANWVLPTATADGNTMLDVLVIGAGMCGLTAGFQLYRHGVRNIRLLDRAPAGQEGPWVTYARMETLRSPKHLTGPACGLANLSFRAWFEAQWPQAWDELGKIPRAMWMDYLRWYRDVLSLPVENGRTVTTVRPLDPTQSNQGFEVIVDDNTGQDRLFARRIVLATGREGVARARVPAVFEPFMGSSCWHSSDAIDFDELRGKSIAVIGWAASAVDNAATALEQGAKTAELIARKAVVPRINKAKSLVYPGFTEGFPALDDAMKLETLAYIAACGVAAPRDSVLRLAALPGFSLRLGAETTHIERANGRLKLRLREPQGATLTTVDQIILGTGFRIDIRGSSLLRSFTDHIARWRDRFDRTVPAGADEFLDFPYLGPGFEFLETEPGTAPYINDIYCFTHAATLSHGLVSSDIPSVSEGADRLAKGVARGLFLADAHRHRSNLQDYEDPELLGDELHVDSWWPALAP